MSISTVVFTYRARESCGFNAREIGVVCTIELEEGDTAADIEKICEKIKHNIDRKAAVAYTEMADRVAGLKKY